MNQENVFICLRRRFSSARRLLNLMQAQILYGKQRPLTVSTAILCFASNLSRTEGPLSFQIHYTYDTRSHS